MLLSSRISNTEILKEKFDQTNETKTKVFKNIAGGFVILFPTGKNTCEPLIVKGAYPHLFDIMP